MLNDTYAALPAYRAPEPLFGPVDERRKTYEESLYDKWHCIRTILGEQYLWDMRCWDKPKWQYTKDEIKEQIIRWVRAHNSVEWLDNCGHCVYCMRKLLVKNWMALDDVASLVWRNNYIKYPHDIGTWNNGFED